MFSKPPLGPRLRSGVSLIKPRNKQPLQCSTPNREEIIRSQRTSLNNFPNGYGETPKISSSIPALVVPRNFSLPFPSSLLISRTFAVYCRFHYRSRNISSGRGQSGCVGFEDCDKSLPAASAATTTLLLVVASSAATVVSSSATAVVPTTLAAAVTCVYVSTLSVVGY